MEIIMSGAATASMSADSSPRRGSSPTTQAWSSVKDNEGYGLLDFNHGSPREKFNQLWSAKPFEMAPDDKVLELRAFERAKLKEERRRENLLSVSEKETFASKLGSTRWSEELKRDMAEIDAKIAKEMAKLKVVTVLPVEHFHMNKENMAEFVYKKREIFLAQMSLDTKRAEIRKIEDKIFQREEALRKSENMLAEDSLQFDSFLKQNDEKVQEALKKAEQQTKMKQDKVAEAAKLQATTSILKRDVEKYKEQLDDCKKYQNFIMSLTPKEWLDAQGNAAEGSTETPSDDTVEKMFFSKPSQLLEVFNKLEEKNLMLMQECQDSENALEDLRNKLRETRDVNDVKLANLHSQLEALEASVKAEEELQINLQSKIKLNMVDRKSEYTSEEIAEKVTEVYERCGFELDTSLGVIQMLTNIEARLEDNAIQLEGVPHDIIEQTEKSNEKDRRLRIRATRLETARVEQERRAMKSLERSQAPVHKRAGKPVMFRSVLIKKKKEKMKVARTVDERELVDFLARSY